MLGGEYFAGTDRWPRNKAATTTSEMNHTHHSPCTAAAGAAQAASQPAYEQIKFALDVDATIIVVVRMLNGAKAQQFSQGRQSVGLARLSLLDHPPNQPTVTTELTRLHRRNCFCAGGKSRSFDEPQAICRQKGHAVAGWRLSSRRESRYRPRALIRPMDRPPIQMKRGPRLSFSNPPSTGLTIWPNDQVRP